jgi:hypothetical protein
VAEIESELTSKSSKSNKDKDELGSTISTFIALLIDPNNTKE